MYKRQALGDDLCYEGINWDVLLSAEIHKDTTFGILSDFNEWVLETHEETLRIEIDNIMRG